MGVFRRHNSASVDRLGVAQRSKEARLDFEALLHGSCLCVVSLGVSRAAAPSRSGACARGYGTKTGVRAAASDRCTRSSVYKDLRCTGIFGVQGSSVYRDLRCTRISRAMRSRRCCPRSTLRRDDHGVAPRLDLLSPPRAQVRSDRIPCRRGAASCRRAEWKSSSMRRVPPECVR